MPNHHPPNKKPFLSLLNATFRLGDRLIFENTNWTLRAGEQWAVIGPNASGKSVLADGLCGRLPIVQGEINYHFGAPAGLSHEESIGHVAFEDRKSELHGTVVQSRWNSFEEESSMRVDEFLSYDRVMDINPFDVSTHHTAARRAFERRSRRTVSLLQIREFLSRRLLSLSNGERQRVQLARALSQPLRLLILDEPYVGLDRSTREYLHRLLERLLKTRLHIILLTSRPEDLPEHITHLLFVEDCRVITAGPRSRVMTVWRKSNRPRNNYLTPLVRRKGRGQNEISPAVHPSKRSSGKSKAALIDLRHVTVRYGASTILNDLSWTVHEGESWALLGPNGSGKTTLLSLIQGDNPQAYVNDVTVFGRKRGDGESIWHLKKAIGWVSPELQLHFDDSVSVLNVVLSGFYETIGLFENPTPAQLRAARRWLTRFSLVTSADLPMFSLSAGLQRMTLLARALVKTPRLLILDEPCQGLDPAHRDLIVSSVDALIRSGSVTAIYVTHRSEEIPSSIKRVLRLGKRILGK